MSRPRSVVKAQQKALKAEAKATGGRTFTSDSFQNLAANLGVGANNLTTHSTYGFNPVSRIRLLLEWAYRGSWMVGQAVDAPAEDMVKNGIEIMSQIPPDQVEALQAALKTKLIWQRLCEAVKWSRLYGGAIAVVCIDGQDMSTPLRLEAVGPGQFKGLMVLDRWMVNPTLENLVADPGSPHFGLPAYYKVLTDTPYFPRKNIHYTRVIRFDGIKMPWWQAIAENLWGISVIERLWDRLIAFDSTSTGIAQLVYKAYLRTMKVKDLRMIAAQGGDALAGLTKQIAFMRQTQSLEGVTLVDAEDEFDTHTFTFAGLEDVLNKMGEQVSGALQIPLVRLFGQSPGGLNSNGESDLRTYYDGIHQKQVDDLDLPLQTILRLEAASQGIKLDKGFAIAFKPLWQMTETEKVDHATKIVGAVDDAFAGNLISQQVALKELRAASRINGVFTNITDADIEAADDEVPDPSEMDEELPGGGGLTGGEGEPEGSGRPPSPSGEPKTK